MEIQLQELIDQIKKDGVAQAQTQADSILAEAKAQAAAIVSDAQAQADRLLAQAKAENERLVKSSEDAIRQAGRNLLISFRESVAKELTAIAGEKVEAAYDSKALEALLVKAVENWTARPDAGELTVLLNGEDLDRLEKSLQAELKKRMLAGVTLKAGDQFDGGFRGGDAGKLPQPPGHRAAERGRVRWPRTI